MLCIYNAFNVLYLAKNRILKHLSKNIQNIQYKSTGDIMDNEDLKEFVDTLDRIMDKHADDLQQLMEYVFEDLIDSYDKLIAQRKECVDKYIKFISFALQDERDINKPIQALMEKQHNDVDKFEKEIAPIKEFQDMLFAENTSEDQLKEVVATIKNI